MVKRAVVRCLIGLAGCLLLGGGTVWADPVGSKRLNILLVVAEDTSKRVGAFGDAVAQTPALDALAREGIRYTNVFTASGVCAPSRSALITGVHPLSLGTQYMRTAKGGPIPYEAVPPAEVKAFPELLRRAGYVTANVAKTDYQFGEPFTIWDIFVGDLISPPDLAVWRRLPKDKPFFAMINLMSTHESRLASPEATVSPDLPFARLFRALIDWRAKHVEAVTDPARVGVPAYFPDVPRVRNSIAQHYDNIHYMDGEVGQILANLKEDGLADDTVVIWTTDHGDGFPRAKRAVYDSGLNVPLIVRMPNGSGAGTIDDRMISFVDLGPTILALAGAEAPAFIQGHNFLGESGRQYIHAARDRMDNVPDRVRAIRDERYKYIRNLMPQVPYFRPLPFRDMFPIMQALWDGSRDHSLNAVQSFYFTAPRPTEELYDTQSDPDEVTNLAADPGYAEVLTRMREAMDEWLATLPQWASEDEAAMVESMWPGGVQPVTAAPEIRIAAETGQVSLTASTPGASIGYRIAGSADEGRWLLYSEPFEVRPGDSVEAKAVRYGYRESTVSRATAR